MCLPPSSTKRSLISNAYWPGPDQHNFSTADRSWRPKKNSSSLAATWSASWFHAKRTRNLFSTGNSRIGLPLSTLLSKWLSMSRKNSMKPNYRWSGLAYPLARKIACALILKNTTCVLLNWHSALVPYYKIYCSHVSIKVCVNIYIPLLA